MTQTDDAARLDTFQQFYRRYCADAIATFVADYPTDTQSLTLDWMDLYKFDPELADELAHHPASMLDTAAEALATTDQLAAATDDSDRAVDPPLDPDRVQIRVANYPETTPIRELRATDLHTLVSVTGVVRKATPVRPHVETAAFECQRCGTHTMLSVSGTDFQEPHECRSCERQGPFQLDFDQSEFIDVQFLKIQEQPEGLRGGETPQSIEVFVDGDATGSVTPGDQVTATGELKLDQQSNNQSPTFDVYLAGSTVTVDDQQFEDVSITDANVQAIRELAGHPDIYTQLVDSFAPTIYGYDQLKLAIILQLFSGVTKHLPDDTRVRGDIHLLMVGDPGTGKSMLLQFLEQVSPRSVYTSGKGVSSAGLTASAVKDDFGDTGTQWSLEAGALVLADNGVAAIDELDKMNDQDASAMHEALEQQTVSISKAGINATLKSRCSVLAAANPKYGRFDDYEPIAEQIQLNPALISRFDLIFTVTDTPDEETDQQLADHILSTHYAGELYTKQAATTDDVDLDAATDAAPETVNPPIDLSLLQKYIAYAKQTCFPSLTPAAKDRIEEFYVNLRTEGADEDVPVPVTARRLEALIRLAEASARVRLADDVTAADADRAISLVRSCLDDIGIDPETGEYDADRVAAGTTATQRDRRQKLPEVIDEVADESDEDRGAPRELVIERAQERFGCDAATVEHDLEVLQEEGAVYEPGTDVLRTI